MWIRGTLPKSAAERLGGRRGAVGLGYSRRRRDHPSGICPESRPYPRVMGLRPGRRPTDTILGDRPRQLVLATPLDWAAIDDDSSARVAKRTAFGVPCPDLGDPADLGLWRCYVGGGNLVRPGAGRDADPGDSRDARLSRRG